MRRRVGHYRKEPIRPGEDPVVGCVLIRNVRFFGAGSEAEAPPEFASNVVQGKTYDLASFTHSGYFLELLDRLLGHHVDVDLTQPWRLAGPVYGDPRLAPQRLGQQAFRAVVLDAYSGRCAITGDRVRPVLQAAHIRPLPRGGEHRLDNGLLLRSDVHTLYDSGYVGVDDKHRLLVSPALREEFGNSTPAPASPWRSPTAEHIAPAGSSLSGTSTRCSRRREAGSSWCQPRDAGPTLFGQPERLSTQEQPRPCPAAHQLVAWSQNSTGSLLAETGL
jgi:hypothetical protein